MDNVIINKIAIIDRCLLRINEVFENDEVSFRQDFTRQDSVILNLQRACEACIDLANHTSRLKQLGIPQSSRDSFNLLMQANLIDTQVGTNLQKMVGLRNIAVHDYQTLNLDIVVHVIKHQLSDFREFSKQISRLVTA